MMSREAAVKLSRALSPNPQELEEPIQIQPAPGASSKQAADDKAEHAKATAKAHSKTKAAPKAAKKHAAAKKEKPKAKSKPKAKKE
jgi:phage protein D